jgi:hypothetical protein
MPGQGDAASNPMPGQGGQGDAASNPMPGQGDAASTAASNPMPGNSALLARLESAIAR